MTSANSKSSMPLEPRRKANVVMNFSEFEIPPMKDVMLIGRRSPIGPEAVKRMVDAVAPEQYEIIKLDDDEIFEAVVVKKSLLKILPEKILIPLVIEEGKTVSDETMVLKIQLNVNIQVSRSVDL